MTFQQLIVLANKDGEVDMTPQAIAARTSIPMDIITRGLEQLAAPDTRSRTPDEQGRRIILMDAHRNWGWRLTNYKVYAAIRTAEERREYFKQYKREARAKKKGSPPAVHTVHQPSTDSTDVVAVVVADSKTPTAGEKKARNGVGTLEAGELVNRIKALAQKPPQGNAYINKQGVTALGADVVRAFEAIGGAKRFLKDDDYTLRDFTSALREARLSRSAADPLTSKES